ncbi:tripartite tricarboxylate transporter substrate-binding protein [Dankookia sp. P2]|uniref:tripartite tricarboxylate transporter substrate-binding protein n=1 Tax=Dankookia sp. P2 TaxID=3423955 RepID=UPI003D66DA8D
MALLRDGPKPLTYGSAGPGSINHLSAHMLAMRAGGKAEHVPYRGAALVVLDLIAGNVDFLVEGIASLHGHVRAGALRGLAVTGEARSALLPDVPTAMEAGLAGFRILNWFAGFAPAGTAAAPLAAGLQGAVRGEAVAARLVENGIDPVGSDAAHAGAVLGRRDRALASGGPGGGRLARLMRIRDATPADAAAACDVLRRSIAELLHRGPRRRPGGARRLAGQQDADERRGLDRRAGQHAAARPRPPAGCSGSRP